MHIYIALLFIPAPYGNAMTNFITASAGHVLTPTNEYYAKMTCFFMLCSCRAYCAGYNRHHEDGMRHEVETCPVPCTS